MIKKQYNLVIRIMNNIMTNYKSIQIKTTKILKKENYMIKDMKKI